MDDTISRQMAIDAVNTALFPKINTAKDAEKALRNLPSAQPEQDEWCTDCKEYDPKKHCCPRFNKVIRNALKDAQPERKKGKWIIKAINTFELAYGSTGYEPVYECSECGGIEESYLRLDEPIMPEDADFPEYCPNCGARMEK